MALVICSASVAWFHAQGALLYSGDATAHVNIARRLWDSRTPGYEQIGTVWLPLPHWIMSPFTRVDSWWRTGLAGALPAALFHATGAVLFFAALRRVTGDRAASFAGLAVYLANPNALYLGSTPMTEPFFAAALMAMLFAAAGESRRDAVLSGVAACAATLIRYEGWFLIPFFSLWWLRRGWRHALSFAAAASAGPVYWLLHNGYLYGDPLEFYHGPYSAKAIYQRALDGGMARYPGDHDMALAWLHFRTAAVEVTGWPLACIGMAGVAASLLRQQWLIGMPALPPVFYVLSLYSSGTPIFVPGLWPHSHYNTRYGLAAFPLLAAGAAMLVALTPFRFRRWAAAAVVLAPVSYWTLNARPAEWICWEESRVNSEARRAWTDQTARFLLQHYRGGGILTTFGDLTGAYQQAGIPLRETLHEGDSVYWLAQTHMPRLFLREEWAVAIAGDKVATALVNTQRPSYDLWHRVAVKGAPVVEVYRRGNVGPRLPAAATVDLGTQ
jgi:hypothetical protein